MFSSVICRAARAHAPLPTASYITGVSSTASITASSRQFTSRGHRRRYSSSKPSSPPDDSTKVAAQQQTPATTTSRTRAESDKRSVTRLSKRKAKDALVEAPTTVKGSKDETSVNINLPSVPSTHHLHPADVAVSAFFSLHRPISVTAAVPSTSTPISFNEIFDPQKRSASKPAHQPSDVINTLAAAVQNLEATVPSAQQQELDEETDLRTAVTQASVSNAEINNRSLTGHGGASNNSPLQFPTHLLSGKFKPFTPPPPPSPMGAATATSIGKQRKTSPTTRKSYSMGVTIHESTSPDGKVTYTAQITSPILTFANSRSTTSFFQSQQPSRPPIRFLDRMILRQQRWEEYMERRWADHIDNLMEKRGLGARERERFWAISVKRQRKLKMKKHKYKKLMKRTRNIRRRLDKL